MGYLGKDLVGILNENKAVDTMTGDGSDTTLALSRTPGTVNNVEVFMDGILQTPGVEYTLSGSTVTFTTAPETGVIVVAVSGNDSTIITPEDLSVTTAKILDNTVTTAKIGGTISASKLSGALPALNGSALTNLPAANLTGALPAISGAALTGINSVTKSTSDPAINTNPSTGVGTLWLNKNSGEMYVCTDATAGENVWTNVGAGTGDVQPWVYAGSTSGYTFGGSKGSGASNNSDHIDKYSFASGASAPSSQVASLPFSSAYTNSAIISATHAYNMGGQQATGPGSAHGLMTRFAFASDTQDNSITGYIQNSGSLSSQVCLSAGAYGFVCGGYRGNGGLSDNVDKVSTVSDSNSTASTDLSRPTYQMSPATDNVHGYLAGGYKGNPAPTAGSTRIERMSFASEANSGEIGNLATEGNSGSSGISSATHAYHPGIQSAVTGVTYSHGMKYAFASSGITTSNTFAITAVGSRSAGASASSASAGFIAMGATSSNVQSNAVDTFLFSSDTTIANIGTLSRPGRDIAGAHV